MWEEVADEPCECEDLVSVGGPVQGPLIALHSSLVLAETQVMPAGSVAGLPIYISFSRGNLNDLVRRREQPFRIFSGIRAGGQGSSNQKSRKVDGLL